MDVMYRDDWFSVDHLKWARMWLLMGVLLITAIFYLSLTSASIIPVPHFRHIDKVMHLLAYAVLMGWFIQIFHDRRGRLFVACLFIAMGVGIEFLQGMHPRRQFDVIDMLANTGGVVLALLAGMTWMDSILIWLEKSWLNLTGSKQ